MWTSLLGSGVMLGSWRRGNRSRPHASLPQSLVDRALSAFNAALCSPHRLSGTNCLYMKLAGCVSEMGREGNRQDFLNASSLLAHGASHMLFEHAPCHCSKCSLRITSLASCLLCFGCLETGRLCVYCASLTLTQQTRALVTRGLGHLSRT